MAGADAGTDGNLFAHLAGAAGDERIDALLDRPGLRIERIVSTGQASPPGFWYDQEEAEWVLLVAGAAGLQFEDEEDVRTLRPGDHLLIPAHRRHRVAWTASDAPTVWLAVHFRDEASRA
ncbi:cupin 2 domain-containing protein [Constrictibacter sp. MBR-5]|jgi:cupin 2 domain-containing protein|uniref:cupin domain-containing protein n=1 Tax=Constrictibacter sp. MBR-5 TaxID=3156467 RepID=UPI0033968C24